MNIDKLNEMAASGGIQELELLSLEGGFYVLRALTTQGPQSLHDAQGEVMRLRSTTELRQLLAHTPPLPCWLVQHVVHDEMCGQREGPLAPLRIPLSLEQTL
ncbi:metal ABC transporter ATPase [Pseudomonas sp. S75]|uniref:DUF6482 family protein n=1 Tax=unclassified Pseudomonas TaxID=196821 RepID=UPI0019053FDD|nr:MULTISPECIES: DUF6482 family protein [unclassified Pseudomonas]MBJ9975010.1 metal ABC transporter ATPase [Pseudomonas sp. S30]MBK0152847.1 metal ABC transporter ATPase [Pseudomonas sp. S75]